MVDGLQGQTARSGWIVRFWSDRGTSGIENRHYSNGDALTN